jgi:hypothetical protein
MPPMANGLQINQFFSNHPDSYNCWIGTSNSGDLFLYLGPITIGLTTAQAEDMVSKMTAHLAEHREIQIAKAKELLENAGLTQHAEQLQP